MTIEAGTVHLKSNPKHATRNATAKSAPLLWYSWQVDTYEVGL